MTLRVALRRLVGSTVPTTAIRGPNKPFKLQWRPQSTVSAKDLQFGQPVYETHPHLLSHGELTPGITAQEYAQRRAAAAHAIYNSNAAPNPVIILAASDLRFRSGAVFYPYRQDSNFFYLTGFNEPESVAVIRPTGPGFDDHDFHLFVRPKDPKVEQWSGPFSGVDAARDVFNADGAGDINHLERLLPSLLSADGPVLLNEETTNPLLMKRIKSILETAGKAHLSKPVQPILNERRQRKSEAEVANMRKAGQVSGRAITRAMDRAWTEEKELASFLDSQFREHNCDGFAYVPVVAGGARGNMIHYVRNDAKLTPGELVLVDAGGEYGNYITDITRTWPVSGKFTPAQRDLYEAVLTVQRHVVSLCAATSCKTLDDLHSITEDGLREALTALGFDMSGDAISVLFPHHVGHYIGLDVHDMPGASRKQILGPGHCITVEPGVYVPDDERWPKHFRGMAIRIEDSLCVEKHAPLIFTTEAVKEVVDIETLRD